MESCAAILIWRTICYCGIATPEKYILWNRTESQCKGVKLNLVFSCIIHLSETVNWRSPGGGSEKPLGRYGMYIKGGDLSVVVLFVCRRACERSVARARTHALWLEELRGHGRRRGRGRRGWMLLEKRRLSRAEQRRVRYSCPWQRQQQQHQRPSAGLLPQHTCTLQHQNITKYKKITKLQDKCSFSWKDNIFLLDLEKNRIVWKKTFITLNWVLRHSFKYPRAPRKLTQVFKNKQIW